MHNIPVQGKPIRHSLEDEVELRTQISEFKQKQLMGPSSSNYSCSTFIVQNHAKQKHGKARMVIDYGPLNDVTIDIKWPLPNKENLIQRVA